MCCYLYIYIYLAYYAMVLCQRGKKKSIRICCLIVGQKATTFPVWLHLFSFFFPEYVYFNAHCVYQHYTHFLCDYSTLFHLSLFTTAVGFLEINLNALIIFPLKESWVYYFFVCLLCFCQLSANIPKYICSW